MMQKYGVENATDHFMSFNTICDATQVSGFYADDSEADLNRLNLIETKG